MPTYNYRCEDCEFEEAREQKFGAPKKHECIECGGTCKRVINLRNEVSVDAATPGKCAALSRENRSANVVMTRIREKLGKPPKEDPDDLAADRHWGRKNGLVKGNKGD